MPEGLEVPPGHEGSVLKPNKSLHGLKEPRREWNRKITRFLKINGFRMLISDNSQGDPVSYAHAGYGDDKDDRRSTNGYTALIGNGAILWSSKTQRCKISSTTEADYISMCQASIDIVCAMR